MEREYIEGYAAVFYDGTPSTQYALNDRSVERIDRRAFDRAIAEDDVVALFNHNRDNVLGRLESGTLELSVDARGLKYRIAPGDDQTSVYSDVLKMQNRGDIRGSSFAFLPDEEVVTRESDIDVYTVMSLRLFDVGPVTFPAYEGTADDGRCRRSININLGPVAVQDCKQVQLRRSHTTLSAEVDARIRQIEESIKHG